MDRNHNPNHNIDRNINQNLKLNLNSAYKDLIKKEISRVLRRLMEAVAWAVRKCCPSINKKKILADRRRGDMTAGHRRRAKATTQASKNLNDIVRIKGFMADQVAQADTEIKLARDQARKQAMQVTGKATSMTGNGRVIRVLISCIERRASANNPA